MNYENLVVNISGNKITAVTNETPKRIFTGEYNYFAFFRKKCNGKQINEQQIITDAINSKNYIIKNKQNDSFCIIFNLCDIC